MNSIEPEEGLGKLISEESLPKEKWFAISKAIKAVLEYSTFKEAARAIFDISKELTGAKSGYIALLSKDGSENEVLFLDSGGLTCSVDPELPMPIRGLRAESYKTRKAVFYNDFMKSKWVQYLPHGHVTLKNVLFAPLNLEGKTIGIMGLANKEKDFTEHDAVIASALSELAAISLRNNRMVDLLRNSQQQLKVSEEKYRKAYYQSNLYKDIFTHDINNIFQNIQSSINLILMHLKEPNREENLEEFGKLIKDQINRGSTLVNNIRQLSIIDDFKQSLKKVELSKHLNQAIDYVKKSYSREELHIHIPPKIDDIYVIANKFLSNVFENILNNAIRYNDNKIIQITIKVSKIQSDKTKFVKIEFLDNGVGIPEERKKNIFKGLIEKQQKIKGMGIGLLTVSKILATYGGKILIENRIPGDYKQGSNFIVLIPES
ncbi:MAG: GAF domain-containing protein [Candidatus Lokiarchaeota archaeon]|nr:GAF domain-containing protein [Candidatus Lokiarchaeota archaeon]MBD3341774.1 GAF domain-containing protein [Candidatus Lokiarchaeota archaeon]